jgi:hypothetical protein
MVNHTDLWPELDQLFMHPDLDQDGIPIGFHYLDKIRWFVVSIVFNAMACTRSKQYLTIHGIIE